MPERSGKDINLMNVQFTSCAQGLINILSPINFVRLDKMMQITTFNWFEEIIANYLQFSKVQVIHCKISILLSTISITSNILLAILKNVLFSIFPCGTPDFLIEQHFYLSLMLVFACVMLDLELFKRLAGSLTRTRTSMVDNSKPTIK